MRLTGSKCLCTACREVFGGEFSFDQHRTGTVATPHSPLTRRCLSPAELVTKGLSQNSAGVWVRKYSR